MHQMAHRAPKEQKVQPTQALVRTSRSPHRLTMCQLSWQLSWRQLTRLPPLHQPLDVLGGRLQALAAGRWEEGEGRPKGQQQASVNWQVAVAN